MLKATAVVKQVLMVQVPALYDRCQGHARLLAATSTT